MANYTIVGRDIGMKPLISVSIAAIDQETHAIEEIEVVNAVRAFLAGVSGVASVVAQKYEQVITTI